MRNYYTGINLFREGKYLKMAIHWNELIQRWQHLPEHISPVFFALGPLEIRYYGLMFVLSILVGYQLFMYRFKHEPFPYSRKIGEDYFLWLIFGVILGGRLGYVLFYGWGYYARNPLEIVLPFRIQNGLEYTGISGMSYHGGLIGTAIAALLFCRKHKVSFWKLADFLTPAIPAGYTFGRLGNFLNGELFGRATTVAWGMYFPQDPTHLLRHPSQLYEAFFEGVVLFVFLWSLRRKKFFDGFFFSLYLAGYGFVRFFIEFFREPDPQLGFVIGPFSMGQVLCILMILTGLGLMGILRQYFSAPRSQ